MSGDTFQMGLWLLEILAAFGVDFPTELDHCIFPSPFLLPLLFISHFLYF